MNIKTFVAIAVTATIPLASFLFTSGCESADDYKIDVTPAYTDVNKVNQSVRLSADGWSDYSWKLSNTTIGSLSSTHGESVVYVVKQLPTLTSSSSSSNAVIQTVTVTAKNAVTTSSNSTSSNSTTSVSHVYTGEAIIRHLAK